MNKTIIILIISVLIIMLALNFIPVKFANSETKNNYIFTYEPKTGGQNLIEWVTIQSQTPQIALLKGVNPYKILTNKDFNAIKIYNSELTENKFLFCGNITSEPKNGYDLTIESDKWEIMYPINRLSLRRFYTSKKYLTVYDFNWINVVKNWFSTK